MFEWITGFFALDEGSLYLAVLLSALATIALKTVPVTFLKGDSLPALVRNWLEFIPVAVMSALVGPDIFIYEGKFDISLHNLFLLVSIPTLLVAVISKNYFVTIAFGILLVIACRYFGMT